MEIISEMRALMDFFGKKPGQTTEEFAAEIKALSPQEKEDLASAAAKALGKTTGK
ncbi:MAG: hypothetical protein WC359_15080 [Dehalococcoidia bacterium]|jgi:hypothetical protein